jgi:hypothetical protein
MVITQVVALHTRQAQRGAPTQSHSSTTWGTNAVSFAHSACHAQLAAITWLQYLTPNVNRLHALSTRPARVQRASSRVLDSGSSAALLAPSKRCTKVASRSKGAGSAEGAGIGIGQLLLTRMA